VNKDQTSGIAIGLVVGAVIGLAIGFLYAPKPGKETRQLVRGKALEVKNRAARAISEIKKPAVSDKR
jgi:gas vesicle protein